MDKRQRMYKKLNSYLYNHIWLKYVFDYVVTFFISVLSAAIFAFGVNCFLTPDLPGTLSLVSGGSAGLGQNIALIFELCGIKSDNPSLIFSISYFAINIPLMFLAFFGIGKRFGTFTLVNVGFVTLFTNLMHGDFFTQIAQFVNGCGGVAARALFAGLCTGISSAIAFKFETSAGGFDIVSYFFSLRKSSNVGKYISSINGFVITLFALLTGIKGQSIEIAGVTYSSWVAAVGVIFFSVIYLFTTMLLVDLINVRNKKVQIQINTVNKDLPRLLMANVPHGATVMKGTGAYSGQERIMIYTIISSLELKTTLDFIKEMDPDSFVSVISLQQVYGRFFQKPVR